MGEALMKDDQLEAIANQVQEKMILWMEEKHIYPFPQKNQDLNPLFLERMVRVEEGIKHQNDNLEKMIAQTDRRFTELSETMNQRFTDMSETMNQRFTDMNKTMNQRFTDMNKTMNQRFADLSGTMDKRFTDMSSTMDKRFNRLYTFFSGIFLTILAGMITLIIQNFQG